MFRFLPRPSGAFVTVGLLSLLLAAPALAQAPSEPGADFVPLFGYSDVAPQTEPEAAQAPGVPLRYRLMALGGASGLGGDGLHAYGGLEGGVLYRRVGLMALGQYGTGNDFTSLLLAGGPAVEVVDLDFASLLAYGGVGLYSEELDQGFSRDTGVLYVGLAVRVPVGRFALGATASFWRGELDGDGILFATPVRAHRFSIGVGL
jgi:hypothetical protein